MDTLKSGRPLQMEKNVGLRETLKVSNQHTSDGCFHLFFIFSLHLSSPCFTAFEWSSKTG